MSSSAKVTRPSSSACSAPSGLPISALAVSSEFRLAEKARRQARKAVAHRVDAGEIRVAQHDRGGRAVVALHGADQHVGAVGSEDQLGERAGKARARLDQGHQRARGHIHALEHAPPFEADFAREPVRGIRVEEGVIGEHALRVAVRLEHDGRDLKLVEADIEDCVVKLARELKRPEGGALADHLVGRRGRGTLRAAQHDRGEAVVALECDRDELVFVAVSRALALDRGQRNALLRLAGLLRGDVLARASPPTRRVWSAASPRRPAASRPRACPSRPPRWCRTRRHDRAAPCACR